MGIFSTKLTSPGLPHLKCTERDEFGQLWVILDHSPVWRRAAPGEVDVFNIIFCTQKYKLQSKYLPFTPHDAAAGYSNYSKTGRIRRMALHPAKASNGLQAAQKNWFRAGVENGLPSGKP
jgi:hypothetical protein